MAAIAFPTEFLKHTLDPKKFNFKKVAFPLPEEGKAFELSLISHSHDLSYTEDYLLENKYTPFFNYDLYDGERMSVAGRYVDFRIKIEDLVSLKGKDSIFIGRRVEEGHRIDGVHCLVAPFLPEDGEPILLAEVNGLSMVRKRC